MNKKINIKRILNSMNNKNIKVLSIDKNNMTYICDDGNEYPLMDGTENITIEELQQQIDNAKITTNNILKQLDKNNG